jgi:antitoxin (DNA-binding transcriptional repressor) of toxin-antitoxin stability system
VRQVSVERADLESWLSRAQRERLVVTRKGKPVALVVGVQGLDPEQVVLGSSDKFWRLIGDVNRRR